MGPGKQNSLGVVCASSDSRTQVPLVAIAYETRVIPPSTRRGTRNALGPCTCRGELQSAGLGYQRSGAQIAYCVSHANIRPRGYGPLAPAESTPGANTKLRIAGTFLPKQFAVDLLRWRKLNGVHA